uniref:SF3 helicase domain-containing protein n=1 Tax=viral metagenome TaxID=1070528 RepID=A0A6C0K8L1_9ZZZZ
MSWRPEWLSKLKKGVNFDTPFKDKSCIVAKDASPLGGAKAYCAPPDMETFVTWASTMPASEKCFYELLQADNPRKLYFDLEVVGGQKTNPTEAETQVIIAALVRQVALAAKDWYDIEVTREDFSMLSACSEKKWSYHMVLKNKLAFDGHASMFEFVDKWFRQGETPELNGFLDISVWGKNQCWRMPDSSKYGQDRPLRIQPNLDGKMGWYGDCVVSWFRDFPGEFVSLRPKKTKPPAGAVCDIALASAPRAMDSDTYLDACNIIIAEDRDWIEDYPKWICMGLALAGGGAREDVWHSISAMSQKYEKSYAHAKWMSFPKEPGNASNFISWASHRSPDAVAHIKNTSLEHLTANHSNIAQCLLHLYGDKHVYDVIEDKWYNLNGILWEEDPKGRKLGEVIMKEFHHTLLLENHKWQKLQRSPLPEKMKYKPGFTGDQIDEWLEERIKTNKKVLEICQGGRLARDNFPLEIIFAQSQFSNLLDSNPHLIAFTNCIYDLRTGEVREPRRGVEAIVDNVKVLTSEFVSMNTGYAFYTKAQVRKDNPERYLQLKKDKILLTKVLDQIFPDPEIRDYMLLFTASCLSGEVIGEHMHFFTGTSNWQNGSNGKSYYDGLCASVLGDYWAGGHPSLLIRAREDPSACNPALIALKGKRLVTFQELDTSNGAKLNMAVVKNLVGNDVISGRGIQAKKATHFKPQYRMAVCLNEIPPLSQDDGGSRRRIRVVPFLSKFVENPEATEYDGLKKGKLKVVHQVDHSLGSRDLRLPFMWKLMDYYERYVKGGKKLVQTDSIKHATDLYFKKQDIVGEWVEFTLERDPEYTQETSSWILTKKELGASMTHDLKKFCSRVGLLTEHLNKPGLLGEMITTETKIKGKRVKNYWKGWRIKQEYELEGGAEF